MPSRTASYILVPSITFSGLLFLIGIGGAWYMHQANRTVSHSLDRYLTAAQVTERLVLTVRETRLDLLRFLETSDESQLATTRLRLAASDKEILSNFDRNDDQEQVLIMSFQAFAKRFDELSKLEDGENRRVATLGLIESLNQDILPQIEQRLRERQQLASTASRENQQVAERFGFGLLLLGVSGAVGGLVLGFGAARSVHYSLVQISIPVQDMAGRLNEVVGPILVKSNTDLSTLDNSLRLLSDKTADVVQRFQDSQRKSIRREQLAAVGQLAAGLAHELRNPLMSMKLILQTTAEGEFDTLSKRDLLVFQDEVTRLERMLQTFLDFARPPRPEKQIVSVSGLIERTFEIIRTRSSQQDVTLHFHSHGGNDEIEADQAQLRQVFLNLLLNSLDALPGGGNIWVDVQAAGQPPTGEDSFRTDETVSSLGRSGCSTEHAGYVAIRFTDDGPGLSSDLVEQVFEPFVSTKHTGIGLGLSICRQIVESHDGRISAGSCPRGGGAEFVVHLPSRIVECPGSTQPISSLL
ncbi:MAG: ATP-binding protein [Pirellulaceae bacterium]|nr:hypothetical protein [Planctomycetales bacterium]